MEMLKKFKELKQTMECTTPPPKKKPQKDIRAEMKKNIKRNVRTKKLDRQNTKIHWKASPVQ